MISSLFFFMVNKGSSGEAQYLSSLSLLQLLKICIVLIILVIVSFLVQLLQTKALYLSSPALIMPFGYFSVVLGMILDVFLFNAKYNAIMVVGMVMASIGLFSKFILLYFPIK